MDDASDIKRVHITHTRLASNDSVIDLSALPNPWLDNPAPCSIEQPGIRSTLRYFADSQCKMKERQKTWPFREDEYDHSKVYYYDHRGYGHPPDDIGFIGDVYLDMGSHPKRVWVCDGTLEEWENPTWISWGESSDTVGHSDGAFPLMEHPLLQERFLWFRRSGGICWYSKKHIQTLGMSPYEAYDGSVIIATMLEHEGRTAMAKEGPLLSISASRVISSSQITPQKRKIEQRDDSPESSLLAKDNLHRHRKGYLEGQSAQRGFVSLLEEKLHEAELDRMALQTKFETQKMKFEELEREKEGLQQQNQQLQQQLQQLKQDLAAKETSNQKEAEVKKKLEDMTAQRTRILQLAKNIMKDFEDNAGAPVVY